MKNLVSACLALGALATPAHADNFCTVLTAVRADAPKSFASLVDKSKPDAEHRYASKQTPGDAASAEVEYSSGAVESASWSARWASKGTNAERLAALKKRLLACPFGKQLVGDGKSHATEKSSPPSAIDWTDPKAGTGITWEILAEGSEGSSITVVVTPPAKK